jgi:hypothetical protein
MGFCFLAILLDIFERIMYFFTSFKAKCGQFSKIKKIIKSHKGFRNQGFLTFILMTMEGSGSVQIMTDPDLGGPKIYGTHPAESGSTTLQNTANLLLRIDSPEFGV